MHGFLTRDGISPLEFLRMGRAELLDYGVDFKDCAVTRVEHVENPHGAEFRTVCETGDVFLSRKVLFATGTRDRLPDLPNLEQYYGRGVHHCPYCDGWEYRERPVAVLGHDEGAAELSLALRQWSGRVTLCTHGKTTKEALRERVDANGVSVRDARIVRLEGKSDGETLDAIHFEHGDSIACDALFFSTDNDPRTDLARELGCKRDEDDKVCADDWLSTSVYGCFTAGDAGGREGADVQFVIQAAAKGATAAVGINRELMREEQNERERQAHKAR